MLVRSAEAARDFARGLELVRAAISSFASVDTRAGLDRLRGDLESGEWRARHGHLHEAGALDIGYRLVLCELPV